MSIYNQWNVIFLLNQPQPTNIMLLKRSATKTFAPNYYTGIGGKVEPNETISQSAYRELAEETGLKNIKLSEFARCIIDNRLRLFYFWGIYSQTRLPHCNEGDLEWTSINDLLAKKIIPTTLAICQEWSNRKFITNKPFTVQLIEEGATDGVRQVEVERILNGLK
jgi:8-oxo-dGTP pyrophosphatase MutT (NUDIX family)